MHFKADRYPRQIDPLPAYSQPIPINLGARVDSVNAPA